MRLLLALSAPAFADDVPQFQVDPFWPKPLPNNWILGQVAGIATDKYDHIWVVQRPARSRQRERAAEQNPPEAKCCVAAPPVLVFDTSGNLLRPGAARAQGYQWPENEHGIFVDDNDFVWLAGNGKKDGQLLKFTMDGKFVLQIGKQGEGNDSNATDRLGSPADVAVDVAAKEVFVADGYGNRRVVVFDTETGAYKRHWGAYGKKPSDEKTPKYDPAKPPRGSSATRCTASGSQGRAGLRLRPHQQSHAGLPQGRHVRVRARLREGDARQRHGLRLVFSPDAAQKHIYMIDGMNGEVRVVDRATKRRSRASAGPGGRPGSSPRSTTSRSTARATSTPPKCRPGSACRSSGGSIAQN